MTKRKFLSIAALAASLLGGAALAHQVEKKLSASSGDMMERCRGMMGGGGMMGRGGAPNDQWGGASR